MSVGCQYEVQPEPCITSREIGCQTDIARRSKSVSTQLSKGTLEKKRSHACQAKVSVSTIGVGTDTIRAVPRFTSIPQKVAGQCDSPPRKRPRLELSDLPSFLESEDTTFMDPDDSTYLQSIDDDSTTEKPPVKSIQDMAKYIVYEDCLLDLFNICPVCSRSCVVKTYTRGTLLSVDQQCTHQTCMYTRKWDSQPLIGSSPAGNIHLSAAVYFTGTSMVQMNKVLSALRVKTLSRTTFNKHVKSYIQPAIIHKWKMDQQSLLLDLKQKEHVWLGGDMRADSPGHSAKFGAYSIMDLATNRVVDIQLIQSNEVGGSVWMEKEGLIRSLAFLDESGVKAASLVTDRHPQVQKYLREQRPDIMHYYDVWHVAKGINKKVEGVAKENGCEKVKKWQASIKNHLYWSAANSSSGGETVAKWTSLMNHIQNIHVHEDPLFPACLHGPTTSTSKWLKPATKPYYRLEKVLENKRLLKDISKLSPLHQTSNLEVFHSVILKFAPKNVAFSYHGMLCRLYLTAFHFNENAGRCQARTAQGDLRYRVCFPKAKKGAPSVEQVKTPQTCRYVDELLNLLFNKVLHDPAPFVEQLKAVSVPQPLCSQYERPEKGEVIANYVSRFSRPGMA
ncbi:uncharacterized protein LOC125897969 [Epinephelus fuscoguttatus]|uniref:uncharacterized protein LOC125897969 n=1 Tax=Epinephelus fuscoguttatus TaxID=293821 RepID=UPI0020D085E2|nr:uncharacterized protein LOC125897969 [Epinephelus fuscoguttatus]